MLEALQDFTASRMNSNGTLVWKSSGSWTRDQFHWCWQCQGQCIYPDPTSHWRAQSLVTKGHISLICFTSSILQKNKLGNKWKALDLTCKQEQCATGSDEVVSWRHSQQDKTPPLAWLFPGCSAVLEVWQYCIQKHDNMNLGKKNVVEYHFKEFVCPAAYITITDDSISKIEKYENK